MWHTPDGDRTLTGDEATLFKAAVTGVVVLIKDEKNTQFAEQWEYGICLFDELTWSQRLVLLERVMCCLLTDTPESIELTAVHEAAIGAVFEHLVVELDWEIDGDEPHQRWRELVLSAYRSCFPEELRDPDEMHFALPTPDCKDRDRWRDLVESLADRILWDRDYEMGNQFLDMPPEKSAIMRQYLCITDDYFSAVSPDADSDDATERILQSIETLVGGTARGR